MSVVVAAPLLSQLYALGCCRTHLTSRSCGSTRVSAVVHVRSRPAIVAAAHTRMQSYAPDHYSARIQSSVVAAAPCICYLLMARVPRSQSHATVTRTQSLSLNRGRCSTLSSLGSSHHSGACAFAVMRVWSLKHGCDCCHARLYSPASLRHRCGCCHARLSIARQVWLLSHASLLPSTTQARVRLLSHASLLPGTTYARVRLLSRLLSTAQHHSGMGAIAVTRVSTTQQHSGTGAFAVTRVSATQHHSDRRTIAVTHV